MRTKLITSVLAGATCLFTFSGCNPDRPTKKNGAKSAKLVYVNWAEGAAYTHLAEAVLRDKMGYDVELTAADVAPGYTAVAQGSHDAFMECWPALHKDYLDRYKGKLVSLGNVYEGTEVGLAVPSYVTIDRISELKANSGKFKGHITGIDAGAGVMKQTEENILPDYGLSHMELMASSGPAMTAALADAYKNKEWIVVTAWKPHWMFGRWDMKFLKQDADKKIWDNGNIEIIGRKDLEQEKPELAQFLKNFYLTDAQLSDLMLKVKESDKDIADVAKQWMMDHEDIVKQWIPAEK